MKPVYNDTTQADGKQDTVDHGDSFGPNRNVRVQDVDGNILTLKEITLAGGSKIYVLPTVPVDPETGLPMGTLPVQAETKRKHTPITVVDDQTINSSGSSVDIDISEYSGCILILEVGTVTGTNPTLAFTVSIVDENDNAVHDTEYATQTITSTGVYVLWKVADEAYGTMKVNWAIDGTDTPTFNNVSLLAEMKS